MKKVSKLLSVILTMAMLCSAVVFTEIATVSAANGEYLLNLDFNSGDIDKAGDEAEFTVKSDGDSNDGYLSVKKTTWNGTGYEFSPKTDGSFQVEFDFNFDTNNVDGRYVMLNIDQKNRTADNGVLLLSTRTNGQMYFGAEAANSMGSFDINTWYTYKAYINSNTGYCAVDVCKKADGSYVGGYNGILNSKTSGYNGMLLNTQFGMFSVLGNKHTNTKLDNIKITDVDTYALRTDFKTVPTMQGEAVTESKLSETNGNTYVNVVKTIWNGTGYPYHVNTDRTFNIEFDFNFDTAKKGNRYFMLNPALNDRTVDRGLLLLATGDDGNIYFASENGVKARPLGTIADNTWYTYKAYINADTGYCVVNVYQRDSKECIGGYNGTVITKGTNAYNGILLGKDYGMFSLLGNNHTGTRLDNVVISDADEKKEEYILYADYDTYSTAVETDGTGAGIIIEDGNKVFSTDNTAAWKQAKHNFKTISNGCIQVKFDIKTDKGGCWYVMLGPSSGLVNTKWLTLLAMKSDGTINFAGLDVSTDYPLGQMTANTWYTYDAIIDIATQYCDVKVTRKADGAKIGSFAGVVATSTEAYKGFPVAGTVFERLTINGELVGAKLDNFSIAEYSAPPAVPSRIAKLVFGNPWENTNIAREWAWGANKILIQKDGAQTLPLGGSYPLYHAIDIDDGLFPSNERTSVAVKIRYYDEGFGYLSLDYVDRENAYTKLNPNERIEMTNSMCWKEHTFIIDNALFCNSSHLGGADILLTTWTEAYKASPESVYIRSVEIEETFPEAPVVLSVESDYVGNVFDESEAKSLTINLKNIADIDFEADVTYRILDYSKLPLSEEATVSRRVNAKNTESIHVAIDEELSYGCYYLEVSMTASGGEQKDRKCALYDFSVVDKRETGEQGNPMLRSMFHSARRVAGLEGDKALTLMNWAGLTGLRDEILQSQAEVKSGESVTIETPYHQEDITFPNLFSNNQQNNILILMSDSKIYSDGTRDYPSTAEEIEAYKTYVAEVVKQNAEYFDYYQIWNEPDLDINTSDTSGKAYANLVKLTSPIIREYDPTAKICIFATAQIPRAFMLEAMFYGVLDYADIVTVHPYDWEGLGTGVDMNFRNAHFIKRMQELRSLLDLMGGKNIPIIMTEVGMRTNPEYASTHLGQAAGLVQVYTMTAGENLAEALYQYAFLDFSSLPGNQGKENWGYVKYWYSPVPYAAKPSYVTLAAYNKLLANAEPAGSIKSGNTSAYKFKNVKKQDVIVLWSDHDSEAIGLNLGTDTVEIRDMYGNVKANLSEADGTYDFHATFEPQYIIGQFTRFEKATPVITLNNGRADSMLFDETTMTVRDAGMRNLTAKLSLSKDVTLVSQTEFVNGEAVYKFHVSGTEGEKEITYELYDGDNLVYYTKAHICLHDFCKSMTATATAETITVTGNFKNGLSNAISGKVIIAQYDAQDNLLGAASDDITLQEKGEETLTFEAGVEDGVDYYKVFVWDGFNELKPYCGAREFLYKKGE